MDNRKDARELNEQELNQVSGAGSDSLPVSAVCPHCASDKYTAGSGSNVRKCAECGTEYSYKRPFRGAFDPSI